MSTVEERDALAHELAKETSKSLLENCLLSRQDDGGGYWFDLGSADRCIQDMQFFIDRAVRYLEGEGILKRHPTDPQLIGWDGMEDEVDV
jgi:hypothetical protein